ncbi:MAG: hypothetical protein ACOYL6_19085 [Bacteriovoracaceae bacterium]
MALLIQKKSWSKSHVQLLRILFCFFFSVIAFAQDISISSNEVKYANALAEAMVGRCHHKQCLFVGLGRSPTPISEVMKNMGNVSVMNLPLGSFRYNIEAKGDLTIPKDLSAGSPEIFGKLSDEMKEKLYQHFDEIFDLEKINLEIFDEIVLFDYAQSGSSLFASTGYLKDYLKQKNLKTEVAPVAFASSLDFEKINKVADFYKVENAELVPLGTFKRLSSGLENEKYDNFSQYKSFNLKKDAHFETNPNYEILQSKIKETYSEVIDKSNQSFTKKFFKWCDLNVLAW